MHIFDYTHAPERLLTPKITALVGAIREFKGKQELYLNVNADILCTLTEVAKVQSTASSNRIEGIATSDSRMREIMLRKAVPRNRNEREIAGYRDVLKTIHENHDFIPVSPNTLLQLHRDLYSKSPQSFGGNWKNVDNAIEETGSGGDVSVRFSPVSAIQTPSSVEALCRAYRNAEAEAKFDPLLLIPMFVFDFLCIHPFQDGNGRMSRLLQLLLLYRAGHMVGKYISLEMLIEQEKSGYYETLLESSAGWHENSCDMRPFVEYTLGIILKACRELESRVGHLMLRRSSKAERVREAVNSSLGKITKRGIMEKCPDISMSMVEAVLRTMLDEGAICKIGAGRGAAYVCAAQR